MNQGFSAGAGGSGTVTLGPAGSDSGDTALRGGTLVPGNDAAPGSGTLAMAQGTALACAGDQPARGWRDRLGLRRTG